jgi:hypothetical protein
VIESRVPPVTWPTPFKNSKPDEARRCGCLSSKVLDDDTAISLPQLVNLTVINWAKQGG